MPSPFVAERRQRAVDLAFVAFRSEAVNLLVSPFAPRKYAPANATFAERKATLARSVNINSQPLPAVGVCAWRYRFGEPSDIGPAIQEFPLGLAEFPIVIPTANDK